jgi:hypothetical protein
MPIKPKDFLCDSCGHEYEQFLWHWEMPEPCPNCGSVVKEIIKQAPHTDMHSERIDQTSGMTYSSYRELCEKKKNEGPGFEPSPSADKHHGARNESHLHLGKKFSFSGQTRRS